MMLQGGRNNACGRWTHLSHQFAVDEVEKILDEGCEVASNSKQAAQAEHDTNQRADTRNRKYE